MNLSFYFRRVTGLLLAASVSSATAVVGGSAVITSDFVAKSTVGVVRSGTNDLMGGGVYIGPRKILTSAAVNPTTVSLDVVFGTSISGGTRVPVSATSISSNGDLAVFTLAADAPATAVAMPIDPNGDLHWGHLLTIAGYGKTTDGSSTSGTLYKATSKYIAPDYTINRTADYGERPTAIGPCVGDVGTPAYSLHFNRQGCIGIKGPITACEGNRHTYLDARYAKSWIDSHVPSRQAEGGLLVDTDDTHFSMFQNFTASTSSGHYGADSLVRQGNGANATTPGLAMWFPTLPTTGQYDVYAWWVPASNRATSATYSIHHRDGVSSVTVNQASASGANRWNHLGQFSFSEGAAGKIVLSSAVPTNQYVSVDAMLLVPRPQPASAVNWHGYAARQVSEFTARALLTVMTVAGKISP